MTSLLDNSHRPRLCTDDETSNTTSNQRHHGEILVNLVPVLQPEVHTFLCECIGVEGVVALLEAMSRPPPCTCVRVNTLVGTREMVMDFLQTEMQDFRSRLEKTGRSAPTLVPHPILPDIITIPFVPPSTGLLDVGSPLLSTSAPPRPRGNLFESVVVDRFCGEAVMRGADVFAAGVLLTGAGVQPGREVGVYADLDGKALRGGDPCKYRGRRLFLGIGEATLSQKELLAQPKLRGIAVRVTERTHGDAPALNGVLRPYIFVQNLPSAVVAHVLSPPPGAMVLDMCAAPGGKTTHLAALMGGCGTIIACDRGPKKVLRIREACAGTPTEACVHVLALDGRKAVLEEVEGGLVVAAGEAAGEGMEGGGEGWRSPLEVIAAAATKDEHGLPRVKGFHPQSFSHILLDPPCSALGLRPRLSANGTGMGMADLEGQARLQRRLVQSAVRLLAPGGTLVYSTCTIDPLENEGVVRHTLDAHPCLHLAAAEPRLGGPGLAHCGLSEEQRNLVQRFDPTETIDCIGFFCAKFVKRR